MQQCHVSDDISASQYNFGLPHENQSFSPNLFRLSGGGIELTYSDFGPMASLTYHDYQGKRKFTKDQIRRIEVPDLGALICVTLSESNEKETTHFSLLLPYVIMRNQGKALTEIHTEGIKTIKRICVDPGNAFGQRKRYTVTPLSGTAAHAYY